MGNQEAAASQFFGWVGGLGRVQTFFSGGVQNMYVVILLN
jgi:hypothetical protein